MRGVVSFWFLVFREERQEAEEVVSFWFYSPLGIQEKFLEGVKNGSCTNNLSGMPKGLYNQQPTTDLTQNFQADS
ncbi:MAG: hypothetical protein KME27_08005 [Lyngbya sp. HA4199-MV5]|nr:hypothetical protein [Lyngbya sp. HA4199-MV5]